MGIYLLLFSILILFGWFRKSLSELSHAQTTSIPLFILLLLISLLLPPFPSDATVQVTVGVMLFLTAILLLIRYVTREQQQLLFTYSLSTVMGLFMLQTFLFLPGDWDNLEFKLLESLTVLSIAQLTLPSLLLRITYIASTLFVFSLTMIVVYHERISPLIIGDNDLLVHMVFLCYVSLFFHSIQLWWNERSSSRVDKRQRNR
ncbi:hypothetical protein SAMN05444392_101464 [Seinonella peptonophila]|uniref:Uncharacterized protein n=1 Tax=Seinonella peptonophila TaxID=112248 RepID=A0A1M4TH11_9BACL|nr:hypothetical protein [Seinonella peptonophila]SHE43763.1 hypothetical protein SAMN05444392_101464 [Seinonella peptonophila]